MWDGHPHRPDSSMVGGQCHRLSAHAPEQAGMKVTIPRICRPITDLNPRRHEVLTNPAHRWLMLSCIALGTLTSSAQDHSAPMELRHNMPFVQVMVNGKGPFTFGIDTGTGGDVLITPALVQQLHLPEAGKTEIGDPTGTNKKEMP